MSGMSMRTGWTHGEGCADDVIGLYLAFLPQHTHWKGANSNVPPGIWFLSLTWLGQGGGGGGGGISSYGREQRAWGQICLLGEVN